MLTFKIHYLTLHTAGTTCCTAPFIPKHMMVQFQILLALLGLRPVNPADDWASSTNKAHLYQLGQPFPHTQQNCSSPFAATDTSDCSLPVRVSGYYLQGSLQTGAKARPSMKACSLTNNTSLMTGFQFLRQLRTFQKHPS